MLNLLAIQSPTGKHICCSGQKTEKKRVIKIKTFATNKKERQNKERETEQREGDQKTQIIIIIIITKIQN